MQTFENFDLDLEYVNLKDELDNDNDIGVKGR